MNDEGVLDPWVAEWLAANPRPFKIMDIYTLARSKDLIFPTTVEVAHVADDEVDGIPIRIYTPFGDTTSLIVYFHGGGYCVGSIAIMDNLARGLAHACGAMVVSVEYRLAPEHPFPAGLDDCETVTRWAIEHAAALVGTEVPVLVAGESAGGNLSTAVAMRLRDSAASGLAGQVLIYPGVAGGSDPMPSRSEFAGYTMDADEIEWCWSAYSGGRNIDHDPYAAPLRAPSLAELPPAIVILGGCDFLRDEGRAYARRLSAEGVDTVEICYPGQIHGFMNHGHPISTDAFEQIGAWVRAVDSRHDID